MKEKQKMNNDDPEISQMNDEDVPFVYEIEKATFSDLWSEGTYKNYKDGKGQSYYVARDKGRVAAYCVVMQVLDECEILRIAVGMPYRRKGIGEKLLTAAMKKASETGARLFYLEVRESNQPAINLYRKLGFTETGRRDGYYSRPVENAVLMSCVKN